MNMQPHLETARETAEREVAIIRKILTDLERTVHLIESDIAAEEKRTWGFRPLRL